MSDTSIKYYDSHADEFVTSTLNADMSSLYSVFEEHLQPHDRILDLGSGSGRDSRYFAKKGYDVTAVDPSEEMCRKTQEIANVPVFQMKAEDLSFEDTFDAVWACASLLHVSREKQLFAMNSIAKALKQNGIVYCSWKYGQTDRIDNGRAFTDMNEDLLKELIDSVQTLEIMKVWISEDVRVNTKSQKWLNCLLKKR